MCPPLMEALYGGSNGQAWERSRVKVYGWPEGSFNLSTSCSNRSPRLGIPSQRMLGTSYRFTTSLGYFSRQLLDDLHPLIVVFG